MEHDCNDCDNYDVWEGVCKITGEYHHGYDEACEEFVPEEDTDFTEDEKERWIK